MVCARWAISSPVGEPGCGRRAARWRWRRPGRGCVPPVQRPSYQQIRGPGHQCHDEGTADRQQQRDGGHDRFDGFAVSADQHGDWSCRSHCTARSHPVVATLDGQLDAPDVHGLPGRHHHLYQRRLGCPGGCQPHRPPFIEDLDDADLPVGAQDSRVEFGRPVGAQLLDKFCGSGLRRGLRRSLQRVVEDRQHHGRRDNDPDCHHHRSCRSGAGPHRAPGEPTHRPGLVRSRGGSRMHRALSPHSRARSGWDAHRRDTRWGVDVVISLFAVRRGRETPRVH